MSQMLKSSGAMGAATLASRVLGLVREQVYAAFMGTTAVAGAFLFAFTIPNLFRRLLGEGALTAAFIPIFKEKEKTQGEAEMWRAANAVLSGLIVVASAIIGVVMLGIAIVLFTIRLPDNTRLMLQLMGMMFPYMLLVCLAAAFMGMLNARGHFFIPALGAAMLNVVMISSVLFLAPRIGHRLETQIFGLAIGVLVAGVAQAVFQLPSLHQEGFRYRWVSPWKDETVRQVVRKMLPASVGVAAFQINVMVTQGLAFGKYEPIVAVFGYAVRLMELPQGIFGISLATYLLPTLSGLAAEKKYPEFRATLRQGVGYLVLLNLLASVLLFVLAEPIIRLLFEYKKFDAYSTSRVALALQCLAPGLIAFSLVNIFARAFYAIGDVMTPMRVSIVCLALNLTMAVLMLFVFGFQAEGIAVANTISSVINITFLSYALRRKLKTLDFAEMRAQLWKLAVSGVIAGLIAWNASLVWAAQIGHRLVWQRMGEVFLPIGLAAVFYFGLALWFKIPAAADVMGLVKAKVTRIQA